MSSKIERGLIKVRRKLANACLQAAGRLTIRNWTKAYHRLDDKGSGFFTLSRSDRQAIEAADVISLDIFDTLILRNFTDPKTIFDLCGLRLNFQGFKSARVSAEREIRRQKQEEVTLEEIYSLLEKRFGISKETGMKLECDLEERHCSPNELMKQIYGQVRDMCGKSGKKLILTSDMYLPQQQIERMLEKCGYTGYDRLFLSCVSGNKKADGSLFRYVKEQMGTGLSYVHIGDSRHSDGEMAARAGMMTILCPNIGSAGITPDRLQVNTLTGGLYCALVNRRMLAQPEPDSESFRFGYTYFGIVVYAYCRWLHAIREKTRADVIYFASRDMKVVQQVYTRLFPEDRTVYAAVSRLAVLKANQPKMSGMFLKNIEDALKAEPVPDKAFTLMKMESLLDLLASEHIDIYAKVTDGGERILRILRERTDLLADHFRVEREAALSYFDSLPSGKTILFADLNGRATSAIAVQDFLSALGKECTVISTLLYSTTQGELLDSRAGSSLMATCLFSMDLNRYHRNVFSYHWDRYASTMETVFTEAKGTLLSYRNLEYAPYTGDSGYLSELHSGIASFVRDFDEVWRDISGTGEIDTYLPYAAMMTALVKGGPKNGPKDGTSLTMGN